MNKKSTSNTPPQNAKNLDILSSGLDTLHIGYYVKYGLNIKVLANQLYKLKLIAKDNPTEAIISFKKIQFNVMSHGWHNYPYVLLNQDYTIKLILKEDMPYPNIYIEIHQIKLLQPLDSITTEIEGIIAFFGTISEVKLSRIDIYFDFTGVDIDPTIEHNIITNAKTINIHKENQGTPKLFTGFTVGSGRVLYAKLYLKSFEITKTNKLYWFDVWGIEEGTNVWRVEFEVKRKFLNKYGINSTDDLRDVLQSLWEYLTTEYLHLKELDNVRSGRCSTLWWWEILQHHQFDWSGTKELTIRETKPDIEHLQTTIIGMMVSIAKVTGMVFTEVLEMLSRHSNLFDKKIQGG